MKMNEELKATGHVEILMNGKKVRDIKNLVVTVGKNWIASRLADAEAVMGYMAVGTDGSTAVVGQTALVTELKRNALTTPGGTVTAYH